jgi:hypothetical protein
MLPWQRNQRPGHFGEAGFDPAVHETSVSRADIEHLDDVADGGCIKSAQFGKRIRGDRHQRNLHFFVRQLSTEWLDFRKPFLQTSLV